MQIITNILWVFAAFWLMEFVAWFHHKYVMHTFGWSLHKDHHQPTGNFFQRNDMFAIIFAVPSWLNMQFGVMAGFDFRFLHRTGNSLLRHSLHRSTRSNHS